MRDPAVRGLSPITPGTTEDNILFEEEINKFRGNIYHFKK